MHFNNFNLEGLEFPMKVKDIPKFENLNTQVTQSASGAFGIGLRTEGALHINVFELNGTVLTPIHINKNYLQPQRDYCIKSTVV